MVSLFHRLPLGGKLSLKATDEGRNLFSVAVFCYPIGGLFLPNCRLRQLRQPGVAESDF